MVRNLAIEQRSDGAEAFLAELVVAVNDTLGVAQLRQALEDRRHLAVVDAAVVEDDALDAVLGEQLTRFREGASMPDAQGVLDQAERLLRDVPEQRQDVLLVSEALHEVVVARVLLVSHQRIRLEGALHDLVEVQLVLDLLA